MDEPEGLGSLTIGNNCCANSLNSQSGKQTQLQGRPSTINHQPSTLYHQPFSYFCKNNHMKTGLNELLTVTFTLFAVIDVLGSIPLLLSLKKKMGGIPELRATVVSGGLMI